MDVGIADHTAGDAALQIRAAVALYARLRRVRPTIAAHGASVAGLAADLAIELGGRVRDAQIAYVAGLLHDIGKIEVPESVLFKSGSLEAAEWQTLRAHALAGERIVALTLNDRRLATIVGQHHERFDGRGYPRALRARAIDPIAKIVTVADAFIAMREARPYCQPRSRVAALAETASAAGRQFDPDVTAALGRLYLTGAAA